jgi:epsin
MMVAGMWVVTVRQEDIIVEAGNLPLKFRIFVVVRQKAKEISSLLMDDARLAEERSSRTQMRDRMAGVDNIMAEYQLPRGDRRGSFDRPGYQRPPGRNDEDSELKRALDESRRLAEEKSRSGHNEYVWSS